MKVAERSFEKLIRVFLTARFARHEGRPKNDAFAPQVLTPFVLAGRQQKNDSRMSSWSAFVERSGRLYSSYLKTNSENLAIT